MSEVNSTMTKKLNALDIHECANSLADRLLKKKVEGVSGMRNEDEHWKVFVEVLERKAIPDTQDMIGVYEFKLDSDGDLVEYRRVEMRRRADRSVVDEV